MAFHVACVDDQPPDRVALVDGLTGEAWTFGGVAEASRRVASHLRHAEGVRPGDRVGVVLPQRVEAALAHVACARLGAVGVPVSPLFGPDGLGVRLRDAQPRLVVAKAVHAKVVREAWAGTVREVESWPWRDAPPLAHGEEARAGDEDPAFLVYTSGTTGGPKGALLPHRVISGRIPGFRLSHEPFPERGSLFYSPADWSWIGGLMDSLFAPWHEGAPVLMHEREGHFEPATVLRMMAERGVTNAFLPPTALKAMMRSGVDPPGKALARVHSAGEPLAPVVARWARANLAHDVTEVYGLTECAYLVGTRAEDETPEGSMGRPFPGHRVRLQDEEICVERGDPTMMLGYWRGADKAPDLPLDADGLLHTGDLARADEAGHFYYLGRKDDLIKTGGYRVGPAEVEACLLHHPAVAECAVVGVPDAERGQRVKAYVKLAPRVAASPALAAQLQAFVKARLAAHAYPREVEFVDALPLTVSGKIRRRELR